MLEEKNLPLPEWYLDQPQLQPGDNFYFRAFWELSSCRQFGWSVGPIPWRDMVLYAEYAGLDSENTQLFATVLRELDEVYLSWSRDEVKRKTEITKPATESSKTRRPR